MLCLGIESSCDETAVSVVENGRIVLSDIIASQVDEHVLYGGVVPEIASRRHAENIYRITQQALDTANCTLSDIDTIGVTYAPGLIGALLVGVNFAKGLSYNTSIPLVPVHHLRSHIAANYITHPTLEPPFTALVVSGGHSHIVDVKSFTEFEILGKTRDDAAGECLDKAARTMGINYPGGKNLDIIAKDGNPNAYKFPHPHVDGSPLDFSFSGLKTNVINIIHNSQQRSEPLNNADLGASFIRAVVDCLVEKTFLAMDMMHSRRLVVAGGVSANSVLRTVLQDECKKKSIDLYFPDLSLCGDNGAMVGSQTYFEFVSGVRADKTLNAYATMPIDKLKY